MIEYITDKAFVCAEANIDKYINNINVCSI